MVVVFLSFVLGADVSVKQIGLGLAVAVLIDATVVRMVLVPAVMELLDNANWWLPRPLARILPKTPVSSDEPAAVARVPRPRSPRSACRRPGPMLSARRHPLTGSSFTSRAAMRSALPGTIRATAPA